ncbi:MAG: transporter substrate-binding domain-containing protein [Chloroflexota bacterium]
MRISKRLITLLIAVLLLATASSVARAQVQIPPQLPDLKGREIIVVDSNDYVPFSFIDPKGGKAVGYEYELMGEICSRLNCKLTYKTGEWPGFLVAVNQGQFDVGMVGISITDERKQQVDFSKPYITVETKFLVRSDETKFVDSVSFVANKDLKIGTQAGTTGQYVAEGLLKEKDPRIVFYDNFGFSVQALLKGDVDAVISDVAAGRGYIGANAGKLKLLNETLSSDPLGLIFKKGSDLVAPFNAALDSMTADDYLTYLDNKWFFLYDPNAASATPAATAAATATK